MPRQTFTLLSCPDDLDALRNACPAALNGNVMSLDPDSHGCLTELGAPHLTPWSVVAYNEWQAVRDFETATLNWWHRAAHAGYHGVDLLALAQHRHNDCLARLAWAAYVIRRAFEELRPDEVVCFDEPAGHGLEQPPEHRQMPLLHALLRGMAEQAGIATRVLGATTERRFVDAVANAGPSNLPPVNPTSVLRGSRFLLFHANQSDLGRQLSLLAALRAQTDWPVVQLYKTADEHALSAAQAIGHHVWHESQVLGPLPATNAAGRISHARCAFDAARRTAPPTLACLYRNPRVDIHFSFIFGDYLRKMAQHVDVWTAFFERCRPAAIVVNYQAPIYDIAVRLGIPGLFLPHGTVPRDMPWYLSIPPSVIGAVSAAHRRQLLAAGRPAEQVATIGVPSLDPLLAEAKSVTTETAAAVRQALCVRLGLRPQAKLVVLATSDLGTPSKRVRYPFVDWADAASQIEQLGNLAARNPEWTFLLRGHPRYDHPQLYERFVGRGPDRGFVRIDTLPPEEFLPAADVIVVVNAITSAIVEFSLWNKPVLLLLPSAIWAEPDQWLTGAWPHLRSVAQLERELAHMFRDPQAHQARTAETAAAVQRFFDGPPTPAAPRCIATLRRLAAPAPAVSAGQKRNQPCRR